MRVVVTLSHPPQRENRGFPSAVVVEWESERAGRQEPDAGGEGPVVSIFLGGPHDERVRRDIPDGEHIVENPSFDPIGFYGLVGIERGGGAVVQWYRWIENTGSL